MSLTVRELIELPQLATRVHAGRGGLDRVVRFACPCEMAAPWEWLSRGDLLLTSGIGLPGSPTRQVEYVRRLADAGLSGMSVGVPNASLSPAMLHEADRRQLPILRTDYGIPWISVSRVVADANAREGQARLVQVARVYDRMRVAAAAGTAASELLRMLGDDLGCRLTLVEHARGRRLLAGAPVDGEQLLRDALLTAVRERGGRMPALLDLSPGRDRASVAVPVAATRPASLVVVPKPGARLPEVEVLQHVATVAALELERSDRQRDERLRIRSDLLAELLDAPMDASTARPRLAAHGIVSPRLLLAAWGPAGRLETSLLHDVLDDAEMPHLLIARDGAILTLLAAHDGERLQELDAALGPAARCGLSSAFTQPRQASDARRQAIWSLQAAVAGGPWLARYGEQQAPFLPRTLTEAHTAVERVLGPLLRYDRDHDAELVHTLHVFLQCNRSWKRAAERLYVHKQTLVYRAGRIEQLTGGRLDDTQHVAELWFALRALELAGAPAAAGDGDGDGPVLARFG